MEGHKTRHESLEDKGGMGHWQGEMETSLQNQLLRTGRRQRKMWVWVSTVHCACTYRKSSKPG